MKAKNHDIENTYKLAETGNNRNNGTKTMTFSDGNNEAKNMTFWAAACRSQTIQLTNPSMGLSVVSFGTCRRDACLASCGVLTVIFN